MNELCNIPEVLKKISEVGSTLEKRAILEEHKHDRFGYILKLAYDSQITFGITKVDISGLTFKSESIENDIAKEDDHWDIFKDLMYQLSVRELTGNNARDTIRAFMECTTEAWANVILNILKKDLRCGMGAKAINKVYKNLVPEEFCMLAIPCKKGKITYPVYVDTKLDGIRAVAKVKDGDVVIYSRRGKVFNNYKNIERELLQLPDGIYDGEIEAGGDFQALMRTVTKKIDGEEMGSKATFSIFDLAKENTTLEDRLIMLYGLDTEIKRLDLKSIMIVSGKIVNDEEELTTYYGHKVLEGKEGIMIKALDGLYEYKRSKAWQKMKPVSTEDFEVVAVEEGTGKYENHLGAIVCKLPNGGTVNIGSGFKDDERKEYWDKQDDIIGKIVEIRFQEKTNDGSLRFPVFVRWRTDKK